MGLVVLFALLIGDPAVSPKELLEIQFEQSAGLRCPGRDEAERERCLRVERALEARGYYPGRIDGRLDEEFWDALARFRRENGLGTGRRLDRRTLGALGVQ